MDPGAEKPTLSKSGKVISLGQIQVLKICVIRDAMVGSLGVDPGAENPRYPSLGKLYSGADPVAENLRNPCWDSSVTWGGSRC